METRSKFLEVENHIKKQFHLVFSVEQKTYKMELRKKETNVLRLTKAYKQWLNRRV